ncbi:MAG: acetylornithine deacetylase [Myxococcota bacterium]
MITDLRGALLPHLERLVGFDTRNPPRVIDGGGLFAYLRAQLPPDVTVDLQDLGEGCVYLLARRGNPALLINVHVDTVPAAPGWSRDPLKLHVEGERVVGLGACDIKGAAAALLAVLPTLRGDFALLFSSDEEAGQSRCVRDFIRRHGAPSRVLVAEPTRCTAVSVHRGIATALGTFRGVPGHASSARALQDNALHELVRWSSRALTWAEGQDARELAGLRGVRLNLGVVEGGTKPNMIAGEARVRFGIRPPPGRAPLEVMQEAWALTPDATRVTWEPGFLAPPLPAPQQPLEDALRTARRMARELDLREGSAVDFWTEAALFSEAGSVALVYGPGDIAQAHTADEWVRTDELVEAARTYARILNG